MKRNPLIAGTILLTAAGFLSRILGFFYRIFLSRTIGAEGLGIYQMIFPIHGIAFALCAGPIQTSISRLTAADPGKGRALFRTGLSIAMAIALLLAFSIRTSAAFLAESVLLEPRCAPLLPVMALSIPFSAIHACICGYYYGRKKTAVPALSQLVEQTIRISAVFLIARVCLVNGRDISVSLAVWGMLIGEAGSAIFSFLMYSFSADSEAARGGVSDSGRDGSRAGAGDGVSGYGRDGARAGIIAEVSDNLPGSASSRGSSGSFRAASRLSLAASLMAMALPLMGNRLILSCLQSLEAIFVPNKLVCFGMTNGEALSLYGVLTGMALPFILFPSAITNSLAVILLPTVSEAISGR